jgi:hypothetical protein
MGAAHRKSKTKMSIYLRVANCYEKNHNAFLDDTRSNFTAVVGKELFTFSPTLLNDFCSLFTIFGQNFRSKFSGKIFGQNFRAKFRAKISV